ncbi:MAG: YfiR family protein [Gammaproteobacteria bacterium]|nr:YfiR family protein [Gammaproteobacteria bacterium]
MIFNFSHMLESQAKINSLNIYREKLWLSLILILLITISTESHSDSVPEYKIKAAFIYNFARFTQWPDNNTELKICIYGNDPFGHYIDQLNSKKAGSRTIKILRTNIIKNIRSCHVVFLNINSSENNKLVKIISGIKNTHILTMSDTRKAINSGVMVGFEIIDNKVTFEINYTAAKSAGLKISSKLLVIADKVK